MSIILVSTRRKWLETNTHSRIVFTVIQLYTIKSFLGPTFRDRESYLTKSNHEGSRAEVEKIKER